MMQRLRKILGILNSPIAGAVSPLRQLRLMVWVALFVALFLYLFRPFGLHAYDGNMMLLSGLFGLATVVGGFLTTWVLVFVLGVRQDMPGWTVWKWMLATLANLLVITSCNYLVILLVFGSGASFSLRHFLIILGNTLSVGAFPVFFSGIALYHKNKRRFENAAEEMTPAAGLDEDTHDLIVLSSEYGEPLACKPSDLLLLEARDNYVFLHLQREGRVANAQIRNTLKAVLGELPSEIFCRCHRSFIVNINHIQQVSGNAQGLVLALPYGVQVPVSRSYIKSLKLRLAGKP